MDSAASPHRQQINNTQFHNWLRSSFVIYANYVHESLWKKPFWIHQFKWESSCDLLTHVIILITDLPEIVGYSLIMGGHLSTIYRPKVAETNDARMQFLSIFKRNF